MSGTQIFRNAVVMEQVAKYLNSNDLESLKKSSELVEGIMQRKLEIRKNRSILIHLGVDRNRGPLSIYTRVVNITLNGRCNQKLAHDQLMGVRHLKLNLRVSEFRAEAIQAFANCNVDIQKLTVSSVALWDLQEPFALESIKELVIDDVQDVYLTGLLRLLGKNIPSEMTIPADYVDYPEVRRIIPSVNKLKLTGPRNHKMGTYFIEKALADSFLTITHIESTIPALSTAMLDPYVTFSALKYLSVTTATVNLYELPRRFPALELLELQHVKSVSYKPVFNMTSNLKTLRFVFGENDIGFESSEGLDELFQNLETIEFFGTNCNSRLMDAVFRSITAEKIVVGGTVGNLDLFMATEWLDSIKERCKELKIIPAVKDRNKLDWRLYEKALKKMSNLESLHLKNFQQVTPLKIKKMIVEDSLLQQNFFWPGTTLNCKLTSSI